MGTKGNKALIWLLCCLAACVKDQPPATVRPVITAASRVYVVCEGNYGSGNATLYAWEPAKDSSVGDLYAGVNNRRLGDVFQSMVKISGRLFLCINNSDRIIVLDAVTLAYEGTITVPQPRYILPISSSKAYVSSEYHNKVFVIDPSAMEVTDSIIFPHQNTEGMCLLSNAAYICAWDTACDNIYKVDIKADTIMQAIKVAGYAPQEVLADKDQTLWVLSGNEHQGKAGTWTRIDPSTGAIVSSFTFPANADALRPVLNKTKDTLYFIEANYYGSVQNNGIYRMGIHDAGLPQQAFVQAQPLQYFWALGIDPATGNVFVGDPKGFTQKGSVYIFHQDGTAADTFATGLGPGHFYFDE